MAHTQQIKMSKPDKLSSVTHNYCGNERWLSWKLSSHLYVHIVAHSNPRSYTHTSQSNKPLASVGIYTHVHTDTQIDCEKTKDCLHSPSPVHFLQHNKSRGRAGMMEQNCYASI